jgi:hypothetical protein
MTLFEQLVLAATNRQSLELREVCETQAPPELLKRGLFAPPNFLEFA